MSIDYMFRTSDGVLKNSSTEGEILNEENLKSATDMMNSRLNSYIIRDEIKKIGVVITARIEDLFPSDEKNERKLFLYLMRIANQTLHAAHGIEMHGKNNGIKTEVQINTSNFKVFTSAELKPLWDKIMISISGPKKMKIMKNEDSDKPLSNMHFMKTKQLNNIIKNREATISMLKDEVIDDLRQMSELEKELDNNGLVISDLENQVINQKSILSQQKRKLTITIKEQVVNVKKNDEMHQKELDKMKTEIKESTNKIRSLKISISKKGVKHNHSNNGNNNEEHYLTIENDTFDYDSDENAMNDEDSNVMNKSQKSRAIINVNKVLDVETGGCREKKKIIIDELNNNINDELKNDCKVNSAIGGSIITFCKMLWQHNRYDRVRNVLKSVILAIVSFSAIAVIDLAEALGVSRRNTIISKANKKKETFSGRECSLEELDIYLAKDVKNRRKDAMSKEVERAATAFWDESCEVSPDTSDTCRKKVDGDWITHTKHFQYDTQEEIRVKYNDYTGTSLGKANFASCKPYYIYPGPMNTCVCVKCLNIALIKKTVNRNKNILRAPYVKVFAMQVLKNFVLTTVIRLRIKKNIAYPLNNPLSHQMATKLQSFSWSTWFLLRQAITYKRDIVDICDGEHKTDIARNLMCRNALPVFSEDAVKTCGRPCCFADCSTANECGSCSKLENLFRDFELENTHWPEVATITYGSYYDNELGTGKETSDLHEHKAHPSIFMQYFAFMSRKYCYHIAKVLRQKNAHKSQQQNALPHQLLNDIDFSQNFKMNETRDETQV